MREVIGISHIDQNHTPTEIRWKIAIAGQSPERHCAVHKIDIDGIRIRIGKRHSGRLIGGRGRSAVRTNLPRHREPDMRLRAGLSFPESVLDSGRAPDVIRAVKERR